MVYKSDQTSPSPTAICDNRIRVLFVEDHQVLRDALTVLLEHDNEVVVSDTASTAEEALQKISDELDLVILDLTLPGRDGIWLTKKIKSEKPDLPILVLTMHDEPEFVVKALEAGVDGYLTKWVGQRELLNAIRCVMENGSYLHSRIAPLVVEALRRREAHTRSFSDREHEIVRCLVKGLSNSEIASRIRLSVSTVKAHLRALYSKLNVSGRAEAVAVVIERGIV